MFEQEIPVVQHVEKVKKPRKKRAPMSEAQKEVLRERLKKAREAKKAKKAGAAPAVAAEKKPKKPKADKMIQVLETPTLIPTPKMEIKVSEKTPIPTFKAKQVKPSGSNSEIDQMREELKRLRTRNLQHEKELMKASLEKEKLKKIGLDYIASFNKKEEAKKLPTIKEDKIPDAVVAEKPKIITPKRYSTYKKSIWSKYAD